MEKPKDNPDTENNEEFSELMKDYNLKALDYNTPVKGKIVDIIDQRVIIDIGHKTEGILNKAELYDWDGSLKYKVGDSLTVICKSMNRKEGYIIVSKKQVDIDEGWERVQRAYEKNLSVLGKIIKFLDDKKGFIVDMGVKMFLPLAQADIKKIKNPQNILGKEYWFKIVKLNSRDMSGVISRRILLEEERKEKMKKLFDSFQVGDIVKGVVTTITDYGAFINVKGIDALVHKDNISYGRINHPKEKLRKGDEVEAKILEIDKTNNRIALGIKQKQPDPWIDIDKKYPVGKKLIAKVTKTVSFGAFIELEEGVEGLLHISDLTWEGKPNTVEEYVAVGDKLWVQVIELNVDEKKIKLGLKQLEMRPEEKYIEKHKSGDIVEGVVKKVLKSRAFIELGKGVEGVIKISDISYFKIDSVTEFLKEKEKIEAMITSNELDMNFKVRLGLKQLSDDEWKTFLNKNKPGSIIPVKIKKIGERGISVEITKNIEGFVRSNEIDDKRLTSEEISQNYKIGAKKEAVILTTDLNKKRIYLSFKAVSKKRERAEVEKYLKSNKEPVTTIGDLLQNEIDKKK